VSAESTATVAESTTAQESAAELTTEPTEGSADATSAESTEPTEPTGPADDQSALGGYCTIPKAVLPVPELESDPEEGDGTDTVDGRLEDGVCVPDPDPES
jgi:hypothetical protein